MEYVKSLRKSLDTAGLASTQLVGSDGGIPGDQIKALQSDPAFAAAEHIQGTHYPCARDQPPAFWEIVPKQTYWANEDFSTIGGDWDGGCVEGRQYGRGRSGGQVREEYRSDYDAGRGGWGVSRVAWGAARAPTIFRRK